MARYKGGIQGMGAEVTRLGGKTNGMRAFANAWRIGAEIWIYPLGDNPKNTQDEIHITLTSGSSYRGIRIPLPVITTKELGELNSGKKKFQLVEVPENTLS